MHLRRLLFRDEGDGQPVHFGLAVRVFDLNQCELRQGRVLGDRNHPDYLHGSNRSGLAAEPAPPHQIVRQHVLKSGLVTALEQVLPGFGNGQRGERDVRGHIGHVIVRGLGLEREPVKRVRPQGHLIMAILDRREFHPAEQLERHVPFERRQVQFDPLREAGQIGDHQHRLCPGSVG